MNSWNLILATVVIFGTGVITGGLLVDHVTQPHAKIGHHGPPATTATNHPPLLRSEDFFNVHQPEFFKQDFIQRMDDQLQFSPAQREAIHKIIATAQDENHALWTNWVGQSREVSSNARMHIREQLNPDQRKQFEQLLKQMHPAGRRNSGTNGVPSLPTNAPAVLTTNIAGP